MMCKPSSRAIVNELRCFLHWDATLCIKLKDNNNNHTMRTCTKLLCAAATMLMLAPGALAEEETPAFYVMTNYNYWGKFDILDESATHTCGTPFGYARWECENFATVPDNSGALYNDLRCGYDLASIASLRNITPLPHKVNRIACKLHVYNRSYVNGYLKSIVLRYSGYPDMSDAESIEFQGNLSLIDNECEFVIDDPDRMRYYSLDITLDGHGKLGQNDMCYLGLSDFRVFAKPEDNGIPFVWVSQNENNAKVCNVMAEAGKLHMICYELDSNNNVVSDSSQPQSVRRAEGSIDWTDTSWTNEVADKWEGVTVESPRITGHKMAIRAKAELPDGSFSPERQFFFNTDGIFTGIDSTLCDASTETPAYYTLQGVRVDNPSNGIYIRVARGKAEKVAL